MVNLRTSPFFFFPQKSISLLTGCILSFTTILPTQGQPVTSANDGVGTIVTPQGDRFEIHGGTLSGDGKNLFHSLQQLGLNQNQIADFLSTPGIENILTRIVGGEASLIDGLIQVSGSDANLFIMNPAGIIFGSNASLNVLGDFTATTATGIGFENGSWFNGFGPQEFQDLVGNPTTFAFDTSQSGSIVNGGSLAVTAGKDLLLLGGMVVSTGTVSSPEGNIIVAAIPGTDTVRISQAGGLLSLEIEPPRDTEGNILPIEPLDLAMLLTGEGTELDTGLEVSDGGSISFEDNTVETGDGLVNRVEGETITLSSIENLHLDGSQLFATGDINLLAQNQVIVRESLIRPFRVEAGGNLYIQGNQGIDILALEHLETPPFQSAGDMTLVSDGIISTDSHFQSGDRFSILDLAGNPADFLSLYDPIITQPGDYMSGGYTGASLKVDTTGGNGNITFTGDIEINAVDATFTNATPGTDEFLLGNSRALILRSGGNIEINGDVNPDASLAGGDSRLIILEAQGDISTGTLTADSSGNDGGDISLIAGGNFVAIGGIRSISTGVGGDGGDITLQVEGNLTITGNLATFSADQDAGNITLEADGNLTINCVNPSVCLQTFAGGDANVIPQGNSGDVTLTSNEGSISLISDTSNLESNPVIQVINTINGNGDLGDAGNVTIFARNDINIGARIVANNNNGDGDAGDITITSVEGSIQQIAGNPIPLVLQASSGSRNGGNITVTAGQDIITGDLFAVAGDLGSETGGSISLISTNGGTIDTSAGTLDTGSANGNAGSIVLDTDGDVSLGTINAIAENGTGGDIQFNAGVDRIILNGSIDTTGGVGGNSLQFPSPIILNTEVSIDTGSNAGDIIFTETLDGQENLTLNTGGTIQFDDGVGSLTPLGSLTINDAQVVNGNGNITTANGDITFNSPVNLTNAVTFDAGTATITLNDRLTAGDNAFTLIADDFNLAALISGDNTLTLQPNTQNRNITLGDEITGTVGLTAAELENLQGFSQLSVGRNDGTGTITVANAVNFNIPVELVSGTGVIQLNDNVTTIGNDLILGDVFLGNDVILTTGTDAGNIQFNGTVDGTQNLTLDTGVGNVTFSDAIGNNTPLGNLDIDGQDVTFNASVQTTNGESVTITNTGTLNLNSPLTLDGAFLQDGTGDIFLGVDITTNNDEIRFTGDLTLNNPVTFDVGTGTLSFATLTIGDNPLTLTAGEIDFTGGIDSVSGTNALIVQPTTPAQTIELGGEGGTDALDLTNAESLALQNGFASLTIGREDGNSTTAIANEITFQDPITLQNAEITVNGGITGSDDASITLNGVVTLNDDITTANQDINFSDRVLVGEGTDITLTTNTGGGDVTFNSTVDGAGNLTLDAGTGNIFINELVGGTTPFNSFTLTSGANLFLAGGIVTHNSDLTFDIPLTLTGNTVLNTGNGAGNITFNNILTSAADEGNSLTLTLGTGNLTFNNTVGNSTGEQLGAVTIDSVNQLQTTSPINAASFSTTTTGEINLQSSLTTTDTAGVTLTTPDDITTDDITTNGANLTLTSNTGNLTANNLNTSSPTGDGGDITLNSPTGTVTTGDLTASGTTSGGDITVTALISIDTGNIDSSATVGDGGDVSLDPENDITVGSINAQGGTSGTGGTVDITTEQFFQATNSFTDQNGTLSSISTAGGIGGGSITIRHDGGDRLVPFIIDDASINGTAGAITSGTFTLAPRQVFPGSYFLGNLNIITSDRFNQVLEEAISDPRKEIPETPELNETGFLLERYFTRVYEKYSMGLNEDSLTGNFGNIQIRIKTLDDIQKELSQVEQSTGLKSALIYAVYQPETVEANCFVNREEPNNLVDIDCLVDQELLEREEQESDVLTLVLVTSEGEPVTVVIPEATREEINSKTKGLWRYLKNINYIQNENKRPPNDESFTQIYDWLIKPFEQFLKDQGINSLVFILDEGLRTIPLAALFNSEEERYLVEDYSIGLMPSKSLTYPYFRIQGFTGDPYSTIDNKVVDVQAMGVNEFEEEPDLIYALYEIESVQNIWDGDIFAGNDFNLRNLQNRNQEIVHLATHAKFDGTNSGIYLGDGSFVGLNEFERLNFINPTTELLVLSACETALGNEEAELGFTGIAHEAGVKSVLGTLWKVDDLATVSLMILFHELLSQGNITKTEALQQAQIALINQQFNVKKNEENRYTLVISFDEMEPIEVVFQTDANQNLERDLKRIYDPHFWSPFTLIGSPW